MEHASLHKQYLAAVNIPIFDYDIMCLMQLPSQAAALYLSLITISEVDTHAVSVWLIVAL
jgi:hypothetical protein